MAANNYLLQMKNISKSFNGVNALNNINMNVKKASIHALMGENGAGKSTLMKILLGIYTKDSGEIIFDGKLLNKKNAPTLNNNIAMVHQELKPILENDIAENIFCSRYPTKKVGFFDVIDFDKMYKNTSNLLKQVNLYLDPKTKLKNLSISQIQIIEILKAISTNAKLIILDEPTSSLTDNECAILFSIIKDLQNKGISFIYISHKIDEILKISDQVSVLRDGQYIGTWNSNVLTTDLIIKHMVGRELTNRFPLKENKPGNTILKISNFSSNDFNNINFELKENEILGISGLVGAKRTELVETIFGIRKLKEGKITFYDKTIIHNSPYDAIKNNFALLTEDRRKSGIFASLSVSENIGIVSIDNYLDCKTFVNNNKLQNAVNNTINKLNIKMSDNKIPIEYLSGGNQQKALLGRWLLNTPKILILDEPTRGIDVATKYEIYCLISNLAKNGKSIIFISSEMPELLGISDRILVMCNGKITGELNSKTATQEKIMNLATKF